MFWKAVTRKRKRFGLKFICLMHVCLVGTLTEGEKELEKIFCSLDKDNDGSITKQVGDACMHSCSCWLTFHREKPIDSIRQCLVKQLESFAAVLMMRCLLVCMAGLHAGCARNHQEHLCASLHPALLMRPVNTNRAFCFPRITSVICKQGRFCLPWSNRPVDAS